MEPIKTLISIDVKKREDKTIVEREFKYHEDDFNSGPSLFEKMMKGATEEENSDDDEEDE
jgi:hypothetical protein